MEIDSNNRLQTVFEKEFSVLVLHQLLVARQRLLLFQQLRASVFVRVTVHIVVAEWRSDRGCRIVHCTVQKLVQCVAFCSPFVPYAVADLAIWFVCLVNVLRWTGHTIGVRCV